MRTTSLALGLLALLCLAEGADASHGKCAGKVQSQYTWVGGAGNDTQTLTSGNDVASGNGGDDTIYGIDGHDIICGEAGNDTLYGGNGNDLLVGHMGNDNIYGEAGNDIIYTGPDNDYADGGTGIDIIEDIGGTDTCLNGEEVENCEL
jgi:Ca2+-binding RTX toxin-like protein